jgi:hypothetical protein
VANYVPISREEFEEWLDSLHHKWTRVQGRAGTYLVELSKDVAVHVSSSVGNADMAMDRAKGAMYLKLVSSTNGRTLNKKDVGQSKFYRTQGWRDTLKKGVDRLRQAYVKSKAFYDKLATIDSETYKDDIIARIELVPGWERDALLRDFHDRVERGGILSDAQEGVITKALEKSEAKAVTTAPAANNVDLLQRMRDLYKAARGRSDKWTMDFVESLARQLEARRSLSDKQHKVLDDKFMQYRIASSVDAQWAALARAAG